MCDLTRREANALANITNHGCENCYSVYSCPLFRVEPALYLPPNIRWNWLGTFYTYLLCTSVIINRFLYLQCLNTVGKMHLTPSNIQKLASYLHSTVDIQDRLIYVGPGSSSDLLMEVPLGQIEPRATIVITVGLDKKGRL